jgi:hypothetical protein
MRKWKFFILKGLKIWSLSCRACSQSVYQLCYCDSTFSRLLFQILVNYLMILSIPQITPPDEWMITSLKKGWKQNGQCLIGVISSHLSRGEFPMNWARWNANRNEMLRIPQCVDNQLTDGNGRWKYSSTTFDLTTRWRCIASFTPWLLHPHRKNPWYPLVR